MKKEELTIIVKSIVPIVQKVVRAEAKKILKPLIKEAVEAQVNKILAEQFVASLGSKNKGQNLSETMMSPEPRHPSPKPKKKKLSREELFKRVGLEEHSPMSDIFDDILTEANEDDNWDDENDWDDDGDEVIKESVKLNQLRGTDVTEFEIEGAGVPLAALGLSPNRPFVKF